MSIRTHVIGPITHAISETGFFNSEIKRLVHLVLDTVHSLGEVYSAHTTEQFGMASLPDSGLILERDISWVCAADVVVALLPIVGGEPLRTDGTYIEIGYALASDTPLIIMWSISHASSYNHLIRGLQNRASVRFMDIADFELLPASLADLVIDLHHG